MTSCRRCPDSSPPAESGLPTSVLAMRPHDRCSVVFITLINRSVFIPPLGQSALSRDRNSSILGGNVRMNRLAVTGLALTVAGLLLVVGFWPLTSVSGADLLASRNGNQYTGYTQGSQITVHEKVVDVSFTNFFGNPTTTLEIEDGNPNEPTVIYVRGDARGVVSPGDVIFAYATLQLVTGFYYWEVASPGNVHLSWPIDALFYGIMAVGVVVLGVAAFRKP